MFAHKQICEYRRSDRRTQLSQRESTGAWRCVDEVGEYLEFRRASECAAVAHAAATRRARAAARDSPRAARTRLCVKIPAARARRKPGIPAIPEGRAGVRKPKFTSQLSAIPRRVFGFSDSQSVSKWIGAVLITVQYTTHIISSNNRDRFPAGMNWCCFIDIEFRRHRPWPGSATASDSFTKVCQQGLS